MNELQAFSECVSDLPFKKIDLKNHKLEYDPNDETWNEEESKKNARIYNERHPNGNFIAYSSKQSDLETLVPTHTTLKKTTQSFLKNKGLPDKTMNEFEANNPVTVSMKNLMIKYITQEAYKEKSLMLCGQSGIGKSHCMSALTKELKKQGIKVEVLNYSLQINNLKDERLLGNTDALTPYKIADFLIIDGLYDGYKNQMHKETIREILDYRLSCNKPMAITSKIDSLNEFLDMDESLFSKLYAQCDYEEYTRFIKKDRSLNWNLCNRRS